MLFAFFSISFVNLSMFSFVGGILVHVLSMLWENASQFAFLKYLGLGRELGAILLYPVVMRIGLYWLFGKSCSTSRFAGNGIKLFLVTKVRSGV